MDSVLELAELSVGAVAGSAKALNDMGRLDIDSAKVKVQSAISKAGLPICILVDDVDRLQPQEIRLMFQFLKAVADFDGVSYVLAYDSRPVEQALSNPGGANGGEYLKKFIQVPVRLPRQSRWHMTRYIARAAGALHSIPEAGLNESEVAELSKAAVEAPVFDCFSNSRDVVRCFNLLRLRLPDCKGEVALPELLRFVLLDLTCPSAIELIRKNPGFFVPGAYSHPEFAPSERSSSFNIWGDHDNAAEKRRTLLEEAVSEQNRAPIIALVNVLFPESASSWEHEVTAARSSAGLIKLLYGGATPLAFSVKEARAFLAGQDRMQILSEKVCGGVMKEWLYFVSSVTSQSEVNDAADIVKMLASNRGRVTAGGGNDHLDDLGRVTDEYAVELIYKIEDAFAQEACVATIIADDNLLLMAHNVLVALARDSGLWREGLFFSAETARPQHRVERPMQPGVLMLLIEQWLEQVRAKARDMVLHKEAGLANLLHRWGQFSNNDYSEPAQFVLDFAREQDPLLVLAQCPFAVELSGMEKIFTDPLRICEALKRWGSKPELRRRAVSVMEGLHVHGKPQGDYETH